MKETGDNVDSQSNLGPSDNAVQSDSGEPASSPSPSSQGTSGLEKAIQMFERVEKTTVSENIQSSKTADDKPVSFASMLRRSKFTAIGKPVGRVVVGTVFETLNDDLYIDFGGKFHCVCKAPRTNTEKYVRGAKVKIRLHDLEMSSHFLGAERNITLLEADATLIGLYKPSR